MTTRRTISYDVHPSETCIQMIPNNMNRGVEMYIAEDTDKYEFKNINILSNCIETMRSLIVELDCGGGSTQPWIIQTEDIKEINGLFICPIHLLEKTYTVRVFTSNEETCLFGICAIST